MFRGCKQEDMPPHIYASAQTTYRNMLAMNADQSIVLMGGSGSGKSVNCSHLLHYFCSTSVSQQSSLTGTKKLYFPQPTLKYDSPPCQFTHSKFARMLKDVVCEYICTMAKILCFSTASISPKVLVKHGKILKIFVQLFIDAKAVAMLALLQAFGSCSTRLNNNASRFTMLFTLDYDSSGMLTSGSLEVHHFKAT